MDTVCFVISLGALLIQSLDRTKSGGPLRQGKSGPGDNCHRRCL